MRPPDLHSRNLHTVTPNQTYGIIRRPLNRNPLYLDIPAAPHRYRLRPPPLPPVSINLPRPLNRHILRFLGQKHRLLKQARLPISKALIRQHLAGRKIRILQAKAQHRPLLQPHMRVRRQAQRPHHMHPRRNRIHHLLRRRRINALLQRRRIQSQYRHSEKMQTDKRHRTPPS